MLGRLAFVAGSVVAVIVATVALVGLFMLQRPGTLEGPSTSIHLETVAAVGAAIEWPRPNDPHLDWVSYLPTTILRVPANSTINVQIDQEDGATGLRNPFWGKVFGTDGGNMHVKYFDDKGNPQEGDMTSIDPTLAAHTFVQGADQSKTMALMTVLAVPIFIGVVLMLVYSAIFFRRRGLELVDGPPMLGNTPVQVAWIGISAVVVLFLAVVGITTLASSSAAQAVGAAGRAIGQSGETGSSTAGGQGPELQVQVVAQQWYFTYRYADYGGVETTHLYLPLNRPVELHVTSLDIIHSFWAYQLGVKADANPGVDNVFHVTPDKLGGFQVRCAELYWIWHGHMTESAGWLDRHVDLDAWSLE